MLIFLLRSHFYTLLIEPPDVRHATPHLVSSQWFSYQSGVKRIRGERGCRGFPVRHAADTPIAGRARTGIREDPLVGKSGGKIVLVRISRRVCYNERQKQKNHLSVVFCIMQTFICTTEFGAGNETRTRDPDLGKVVLYQLSYSRRVWRNVALLSVVTGSALYEKRFFPQPP